MPTIEISEGELLDRLSILEVKISQLKSDFQVQLVSNHADSLKILAQPLFKQDGVIALYQELLEANEEMWLTMEELYEWVGPRNEKFVAITLHTVEVNKRRAFIKK